MAKDKKKKKDKKTDKAAKSGASLKALATNPMVADVVAAALVATAAALKDSKRARALASDAGDELRKLSKAGSETGNALWEMALAIGKRSLDAITSEVQPAKSNAAPKPEKVPKTVSKTPAKAKTAPAKRSTRSRTA